LLYDEFHETADMPVVTVAAWRLPIQYTRSSTKQIDPNELSTEYRLKSPELQEK